jgi:integrase
MATGHIRKRGNNYQVIVYAGRDPITKRELYLRETARSEDEAERIRDRLIDQVEAGNAADGRATVKQLLDRWLAGAELEAHLRRCRKLCDGRPAIDHRTSRPHECRVVKHHKRKTHDCTAVGCRVIECKAHVCQPAKPATIRRIHGILSTALAFGVKWGWIESNPAQYATPPKLRPEEPEPLTPEEAGRLLVAAWEPTPRSGCSCT